MVEEGLGVPRGEWGGGVSRRSALGARVFADGQEYVVRDQVHARYSDAQRDALNAVLNERLWTGAATAAQAAKEVKERGDPILKG